MHSAPFAEGMSKLVTKAKCVPIAGGMSIGRCTRHRLLEATMLHNLRSVYRHVETAFSFVFVVAPSIALEHLNRSERSLFVLAQLSNPSPIHRPIDPKPSTMHHKALPQVHIWSLGGIVTSPTFAIKVERTGI